MNTRLKPAALLGVALFLIGAAPAQALEDTPGHLMVKGLETNALLSGGKWHAHCTKWRDEGPNDASARCFRLHKRRGHGHRSTFYNGTGAVALTQKYNLIYWSFEYKIEVVDRGCDPTNPAYEEEVEEGEEGEMYWGCTRIEKRHWSPWKLIFLH